MLFLYAVAPHVRKHGPEGLERYQSYKDWLRDEFTFQCVYCLDRERWYPYGHAGFGVDHVKPKSQKAFQHLICSYQNLVYACNRCNTAKGEHILIDPCEVAFAEHLQIDEKGEIFALTNEGKRVINKLGLDRLRPTEERLARLIILKLYRKYPNDAEVRAMYLNAFGFPDDLPDLGVHTRTRNSKPEGIENTFFRQRDTKTLPETYGL
jgi:hypothetical protein